MFYTYVLESKKNGELYVGYTDDLRRRLKEHNQKLNLSTKRYAPWGIIYYEACVEEADAKRREKYLKTTDGRAMLRLRIRNFINKKVERFSKPKSH